MATFTNRATLTYNNRSVNSNIATGEILEVLSATKTAVNERYSSFSDTSYVISILNSGQTPIAGISISDDLGAYTIGDETYVPLSYQEGSVRVFIDGVLQNAPSVTSTSPLVISGITIPAGGNAIVIYEAEVTEFAPLASGSTITNTATVTGDGISTPVEAIETVQVLDEADLTITKTITPAVVTENSRVTYTFIIQNFGNTDIMATDDAVVTDTFSPILASLEVTLNGETLTEGTDYTYNEATGLFQTTSGIITVPSASFSQNPTTGIIETTPGTAILSVTGTI